MRRVVAFLLAAALVVAASWYLSGLPGQVAATIAGITVETSAPVAALALILIVGALYCVLRLLSALVFLPRTLGRVRARRRRVQGDAAVTRALVSLAAGDAADAVHYTQRARRLLGDTPQTLLLAAEARRLGGGDAEAAAIYRTLAARDDAGFLGLRGLFRQAMAREDWAGAAVLARQAEASRPGSGWLRDERTELAIRTGDWQQALALAGPGAPRATYAVAAADASSDGEAATRLARATWKADPGFVPAALAYARRLRAGGRDDRAQEVLRQSWKVGPHPDLAALALDNDTVDNARLKLAASLAAMAPDHAESHLLLARASLEAGLTAEARRHAAAARRAGMRQKRLFLLLADLEAVEHGDSEAGRVAQHDALRLAAAAEADPAWRCGACGTAQTTWLPVCPACHAAGRMAWRGAERPALTAD